MALLDPIQNALQNIPKDLGIPDADPNDPNRDMQGNRQRPSMLNPKTPRLGARSAGPLPEPAPAAPSGAAQGPYNWTTQDGMRSGYGEPVSSSRAVATTPQAPSIGGERYMGQAQQVSGGAGTGQPTGVRSVAGGNPVNPNYTNGASPEARAYQASRAATAEAAPAVAEATQAGRAAQLATGARTLINGGVGKLMAAGAAVPAIMDSAAPDSTARYARRFGVSEPTGDGSIGDIAKFVGLRAGGFATDLANHLTFGQAGKLYQDNQDAPVTSQSTAGAPASSVAQEVQAPLTRPSQITPDNAAPSNLPAGVRSTTLDNGQRLYSNQPQDQDAAFNGKGGFVSTVPHYDAAANAQADQAEADVRRMKMGIADHGDAHFYDPPTEEQRLQANLQNASIGGRAGARMALSNYQQRQLEADRQAGELARSNATLRLGMFNALREQANKDREFGLQNNKFEFEQGQAAQKDRQEGAKALDERIANMLPAGPDGKPDANGIARVRTLANNWLAQRGDLLQQHLKLHPNDVNAQSELQNLQRNGAAGINPNVLEQIVASHKAEQLQRDYGTSGFNPIGGTDVQSDRPITDLQYQPGFLGTRLGATYRTNTGGSIPARAVDNAEGSFVGRGARRSDLDILKKQQ